MEFRTPSQRELPGISAALADQQADPTCHIAYLETDPDAIAAQLAGLTPAGLDGAVAAYADTSFAGFLAAEWNDDPPRVWWYGHFVLEDRDWADVADALYEQAEAVLPATVTQQEFSSDTRHERLAAFAARHGFVAEQASAVLSRHLDEPTTPWRLSGISVARLQARDRDAVAALHDRLFPSAHVGGRRLDEGLDRVVLVARDGDDVVGYVAAERQHGGDGYLDLLGIEPAARSRGIGGLLVTACCEVLRDRLGCQRVHLTVREGNAAARHLYDRLGFSEERLLVPFRRGFSVA